MQRRRLQSRAPAGARVVLRESGRKEAQDRKEAPHGIGYEVRRACNEYVGVAEQVHGVERILPWFLDSARYFQ